MNRAHAFAAVAILLACQPASAAEQKDFRDWNASCDNLRDCNAYGFDASLSGATYLRIERGGAPFAAAKITLALDANDGVTFTLKFNDPTSAGSGSRMVPASCPACRTTPSAERRAKKTNAAAWCLPTRSRPKR